MSRLSKLYKLPPGRTLPASLLILSLICNVAALALPFMSLRKGLGTIDYSLFTSITLLWEKGLYVLSFLVIAFSLLFPFAKLAILAWIIPAATPNQTQIKRLHQVERFGKWSMLDPFLVSIILSLTSKQFFVGAKAQAGLAFFTIAILLSMLTSELLSRSHTNPTQPTKPEIGNGNVLLFLLSGIALTGTLTLPFLQIQDWLLSNRSYNIIALVPALWRQDGIVTSVLCAVFLIALPALAWLSGLAAYLARFFKHEASVLENLRHFSERWSMLSVFGLALTLFAMESDHIMSTEISWGALALAATLALNLILSLKRPPPKTSSP